MPIVEIQIVGELSPERRAGLARRLAQAAGHALAARPNATWVTVIPVALEAYAEAGGGPPPGVLPVFVRVARREVPAREAFDAEVLALTRAVADACGRPSQHVHVLYEAPASGRLAFGGKVVR